MLNACIETTFSLVRLNVERMPDNNLGVTSLEARQSWEAWNLNPGSSYPHVRPGALILTTKYWQVQSGSANNILTNYLS